MLRSRDLKQYLKQLKYAQQLCEQRINILNNFYKQNPNGTVDASLYAENMVKQKKVII